MARVNEIAAQETQNILNELPIKVIDKISAEEMKRILDAFENSGDEFYKLESFGIFLKDYVISGGEVTKVSDNKIKVSECLLSFMSFLWRGREIELEIPTTNETYSIYFNPQHGKFEVDYVLPIACFEVAKVTVSNSVVADIQDTRGQIGGINFKYSIVVDGGEWE